VSAETKRTPMTFDLDLFKRWLDIGAEESLDNRYAYNICVAFEDMCEASGSGRLLTHEIMSAVYRQMVKDREVASELLAALKEVSWAFGMSIAATGDMSEQNGKALDRTLAAIAKAEGRA